MAGGIRGIRALRVQRAAIEEQIAVHDDDTDTGAGLTNRGADPLDRFERYGGKKSGEEEKKA